VCRAIGRPELIEDPRTAGIVARRENNAEVVALLEAALAERPLAEWAEIFTRENVWWSPVQDCADIAADPQVRAAGGIIPFDVAEGSPEQLATSVDFLGTPAGRSLGPRGGPAHREVLLELGFGWDRIAELRSEGAAVTRSGSRARPRGRQPVAWTPWNGAARASLDGDACTATIRPARSTSARVTKRGASARPLAASTAAPGAVRHGDLDLGFGRPPCRDVRVKSATRAGPTIGTRAAKNSPPPSLRARTEDARRPSAARASPVPTAAARARSASRVRFW
jgi:hypothetical protein